MAEFKRICSAGVSECLKPFEVSVEILTERRLVDTQRQNRFERRPAKTSEMWGTRTELVGGKDGSPRSVPTLRGSAELGKHSLA